MNCGEWKMCFLRPELWHPRDTEEFVLPFVSMIHRGQKAPCLGPEEELLMDTLGLGV